MSLSVRVQKGFMRKMPSSRTKKKKKKDSAETGHFPAYFLLRQILPFIYIETYMCLISLHTQNNNEKITPLMSN